MTTPDISTPGLIYIAVLDDDPDFRTYIEDFLRDEGMFSVRAYAHPEDLFQDAESRVPDIVLLDMKMGEFKGEKVLEQLLNTLADALRDRRHRLSLARRYADDVQASGLRLSFKTVFLESAPSDASQCSRGLRVRSYGPGSVARTARSSHQVASRRTRLVTQGSGRIDQAECVADQFHRAWRKYAVHGKPARNRPSVREKTVRYSCFNRLLSMDEETRTFPGDHWL